MPSVGRSSPPRFVPRDPCLLNELAGMKIFQGDIRVPSFDHQILAISSLALNKEKVEASQRYPLERCHVVLTTCQTTLQDRLELRTNRAVMGTTTL